MTLEPARRELRVSDADREAVAELLREAAGDGRITLDELDERLAAAYQARTYGDFEPLLRDLPSDAPAAGTVEGETLRINAPFNDAGRNGRWTVPPRVVATAGMGNVKLDFTEAIVRRREILIEAQAYAGNVVLIVPEGFDVDVEGVQVGVGKVKKRVAPRRSGEPLLRVVGRTVLGDIVVRHPRRMRFLSR